MPQLLRYKFAHPRAGPKMITMKVSATGETITVNDTNIDVTATESSDTLRPRGLPDAHIGKENLKIF